MLEKSLSKRSTSSAGSTMNMYPNKTRSSSPRRSRPEPAVLHPPPKSRFTSSPSRRRSSVAHSMGGSNSNMSTATEKTTQSRMVRSKRRASIGAHSVASEFSSASRKSIQQRQPNRPTVSKFLRNTHKDLKAQITKIQEQIRFLQQFATMKDDRKIDELFDMIDRDGGGTVDAEELAKAVRKNDELSFHESLDKAIDMVAKYDINGDGELDRYEFQNYVTSMVKTLGLSVSAFCEFIIVELLLSQDEAEDEEEIASETEREKINEEVRKRSHLMDALGKENLKELFDMFGKTSSGKVKFQTVAKPTYATVYTLVQDESKMEALEVFLMIDSRDKRQIDYKGFGRLIMSVSKTANITLDELVEEIIENITSNASKNSILDMDASTVTSSHDSVADSHTADRLLKLFNLWDKNGDGDISASELSDGLQMFHQVSGIKADANELAQALIKFDEDGDGQLDPQEFQKAMMNYAKVSFVDLHVLIDVMCLAAATEAPQDTFQAEDFAFGPANFPGVDANDDFVANDFDFWGK